MTNNDFTNAQVLEGELPDIHQIETEALDPRYIKANRILLGAITLVIALVFAAIIVQPWFELSEKVQMALTIAGAVITSFFFLLFVYTWFADPLKSFALREHDLSFKSGLFFQKLVTQPITRIQHIELERGPIERKIGLARLQVFSAGGAMYTFEIPGLTVEKAQQIRQFILQHKDAVQHG